MIGVRWYVDVKIVWSVHVLLLYLGDDLFCFVILHFLFLVQDQHLHGQCHRIFVRDDGHFGIEVVSTMNLNWNWNLSLFLFSVSMSDGLLIYGVCIHWDWYCHLRQNGDYDKIVLIGIVFLRLSEWCFSGNHLYIDNNGDGFVLKQRTIWANKIPNFLFI